MEYFQSGEFDTRVKELMQKYHVPGLSLAILHGDKTATKAFGVSSVDSSKPCTPDTVFDIASSSKILTAASVALLVEDDVKHPDIAFDTPVCKLLPDDFVMADEYSTKNITLDDILSHRTGIASHDLSYFGVSATRPDTARSITRNLRNLQIVHPPRSAYLYSNIMFTVATHVVETHTETPFADFLQQRFFAPLHMASTNLQPSRARANGLSERLSSGHMWDEEEQRHREFPALECPEGQGAGSIITSAGDYLKLIGALMKKQAPLSERVYRDLTRMRTLTNPDTGADGMPGIYGAGLDIGYHRGRPVVCHNGGVPGFGSRWCFVPSLDIAFVALGNAVETATLGVDLQRELLDSILGPDTSPKINSDQEDKEKEENEPSPADKQNPDEPQKMPLTAYTGHYWNPGYRGMRVEVRSGHLFIDATDRAFPIELTLEHMEGQTLYRLRIRSGEAMGGMAFEDPDGRAEFRFDNDRAVRMGLRVAGDLEEPIWFDRVGDEAGSYVVVQ